MKIKCKIYTQNEMLIKVNKDMFLKIIHNFAIASTYLVKLNQIRYRIADWFLTRGNRPLHSAIKMNNNREFRRTIPEEFRLTPEIIHYGKKTTVSNAGRVFRTCRIRSHTPSEQGGGRGAGKSHCEKRTACRDADAVARDRFLWSGISRIGI